MLHFLDPFRDFTLASVALRMLLTVLCGGLIGIERAFKRRSAGFRTHILICLGAAMTTMTSLYLVLVMHYYTDLARLGAQVIAGIGFIGAGTVIVTKRHRVKGLTTAAGLWLTAIIGLCCGAGFYEGAIMATLLDLIAELWFSKLEYRMLADSREITLYVGYQAKESLDALVRYFQTVNVRITDMEITRNNDEQKTPCVVLTLQMNPTVSLDGVIRGIYHLPGISSVEEL